MTTEHRIHTVLDMLALTPEEFKRFLPDLFAWYVISKEALGATATGFIWIDDGKSGEVHSVLATITETGEQQVWPGSAYTEPTA